MAKEACITDLNMRILSLQSMKNSPKVESLSMILQWSKIIFTNHIQDPQNMDLITSFPISNPNLWGGLKMQKFLEICCSDIHLYLSNKNIFWKTERYFCILFCYEKNPLSVILYSFSFYRHMYFKNMCQTGEFWDLKFRAQTWIWFSQYVTPVGKWREVIFIWHVRHKIIW